MVMKDSVIGSRCEALKLHYSKEDTPDFDFFMLDENTMFGDICASNAFMIGQLSKYI